MKNSLRLVIGSLQLFHVILLIGCCSGDGNCGDVSGPAKPGDYIRSVSISAQQPAPLYIIRFDKKGTCCDADIRHQCLEAARKNRYSDIFVICHGWNNEWREAVSFYDTFFAQFERLRATSSTQGHATYNPLFVGIYWPSAVMVLPEDLPPGIREIAPPEAPPGVAALTEREVDLLGKGMSPRSGARLRDLTVHPRTVTETNLRELATLLQPFYLDISDERPRGRAISPPAPEEILSIWQATAMNSPSAAEIRPRAPSTSPANGFASPQTGPSTARALPMPIDLLRWAIRATTVWMMKDRAGVVGAHGVGPLLDDLLAADRAPRVHLIGHSYGTKVLLSALCAAPKSRIVDSALLLEPAISAWCFSTPLPSLGGSSTPLPGRNGAFIDAPRRIRQPILSTFSYQDWPLHSIYPLILRRSIDEGETIPRRIGSVDIEPFWALGGEGPHELRPKGDPTQIEIFPHLLKLPIRYRFSPGVAIVGFDGSDGTIGGHSDINNEWTAWALFNQVDQPPDQSR